jgi:hypothetical protein
MVASRDWIQHWSTSEAYIAASHVDVGDEWGSPVGLNYTETGLGPRLTLVFPNDNEARFYWIAPDRDWRQNQTYRYKLTNSWINNIDDKKEWYFWNINAFLDSDIRIPRGYDGFACDYVELSYWKERNRNQVLQESDAKIQFYDFSIGFLDYGSRHVYKPCQKIGGRCRAIDGKVTCGSALYWQYGLFGLLGLALLFCCVLCQCFRAYGGGEKRDMYSRVAPQDDDHGEDDEYDYDDDDDENMEDEILQSLKRQAVVELTGMNLITNANEDDEDFDDEY